MTTPVASFTVQHFRAKQKRLHTTAHVHLNICKNLLEGDNNRSFKAAHGIGLKGLSSEN
jgi:hypothetical protein